MERKTTTPARPHVTALPDNDVSEQLKALSGTLKFPDVAHDLVADVSNVILQLRALDNLMYDFFNKYEETFSLLINESDRVHDSFWKTIRSVSRLYYQALFDSDIEY